MKMNAKTPGLVTRAMPTELDLTYKRRFQDTVIPEAYEALILDAIKGDHSNFVRDDELDAAWKIFTPILHWIEGKEGGETPKPEPYPYGSRGPKQVDEFTEKVGVVVCSSFACSKQTTDRLRLSTVRLQALQRRLRLAHHLNGQPINVSIIRPCFSLLAIMCSIFPLGSEAASLFLFPDPNTTIFLPCSLKRLYLTCPLLLLRLCVFVPP